MRPANTRAKKPISPSEAAIKAAAPPRSEEQLVSPPAQPAIPAPAQPKIPLPAARPATIAPAREGPQPPESGTRRSEFLGLAILLLPALAVALIGLSVAGTYPLKVGILLLCSILFLAILGWLTWRFLISRDRVIRVLAWSSYLLVCLVVIGLSLYTGRRTLRLVFTGPYPENFQADILFQRQLGENIRPVDGIATVENAPPGTFMVVASNREVARGEIAWWGNWIFGVVEVQIPYEPAKWRTAAATVEPANTPTPAATPTPEPTLPETATPVPPVRETVLVPGGRFWMGLSPVWDMDHPERYNFAPSHEVQVSAYRIDIYEVTNEQIYLCIQAGGCHPIVNKNSASDDPDADWRRNALDYPNIAVIRVKWAEAQEYCRWKGGDLPTEAQWEKSAGFAGDGKKPRILPWSDTALHISIGEANFRGTTPMAVDSFKDYRSYLGLFNMAGNVREWVLDRFDPAYYAHSADNDPAGPADENAFPYRVVRGGGFSNDNDWELYTYWRMRQDPDFRSDITGFRCAYPAD